MGVDFVFAIVANGAATMFVVAACVGLNSIISPVLKEFSAISFLPVFGIWVLGLPCSIFADTHDVFALIGALFFEMVFGFIFVTVPAGIESLLASSFGVTLGLHLGWC